MNFPWLTVWCKELKDAVRDRRSLMAAMSYALFGPLLMAGVFFMVVQEATSEKDLYVPLVGAEFAPELVLFLEQKGIFAAADEQTKQQQTAIVIEIPEFYQDYLASGQSIPIVVRSDSSDRKQGSSRARVERALTEYNGIIVQARLLLRGVSPEITRAVRVARQDTATKESKAALLMGTIMVFVLMAVFFSGMNVAIDSSAGERERNSLEFLLAQPLALRDLVLGKTLAASTFALLGTVLALLMIPLVFMFVPLEKLGVDVSFGVTKQLMLALVLIPLALLASALQLLVSFMAKSFKEAQTYITFVMFAPMMIIFALEFSRFQHTVLAYLPITSQHQALLGSINGEPVSLFALVVGAVSTLVLVALLVFAVQLKLRSEKTVFGL